MSKKEENQMDIDYVSNLARIELSEEEKIKFHGQLEDVLTYFKKLQTVQTENVEPTAHAFPRYNVWDIDETKEPFSCEDVLRNAPASRNQQIIVPKVVEE